MGVFLAAETIAAGPLTTGEPRGRARSTSEGNAQVRIRVAYAAGLRRATLEVTA